jgi:hypothetical protein
MGSMVGGTGLNPHCNEADCASRANSHPQSGHLTNLVALDKDGNVQLTWRFDIARDFLDSVDTEAYLDLGPPRPAYIRARPNCEGDLIESKTIVITGVTYSLPTDWELPTRPPQIDDLVTKGAGGKQGQMVDVTVTTINQQIRDSSGKATDVVLIPAQSKARITTGTSTPTARPTTTPLSTGSKAGIGVGSALGTLMIVSVAYLVYRQRKRQQSLSPEKVEDEAAHKEDPHGKPELASEIVHEKEPGLPSEAPGDGYTAELPQLLLQQPHQELPGNQLGSIRVGGSDPVFEMPSKDGNRLQELAGDGAEHSDMDVESGLRR